MKKLLRTYFLFLAVICASILTAQTLPGSFRFVFMTDIHLWDKNQAGEWFDQALQKAGSHNADFIITGGDLVMDVLRTSHSRADSLYKMYRDAVKRSPLPVYNALGNHEVFGWGNEKTEPEAAKDYGKKMYERYLGSPLHSFRHKGWLFMFLDGVRKNDTSVYDGWATEEVLAWIRTELGKTDTLTPIILITHIPLMTLEGQWFNGALAPNHPMDVVGNAKQVLELFHAHNLKLVLQGHLHFLEKLEIGKTTFVTGGAVSGSWWKGPYKGTDPGYVIIETEGEEFSVRYTSYGWAKIF